MGETTFGRYHLIAELGNGGMADVFLAVQAGPVGSGFRKLSVIKRLRQNLVDDPEFVEMLIEEARIAARLNHPNVVQTNEVGQVGDQYFIAMEYLDGQPMHRIQHRSMLRGKEVGTPPIAKEQQLIVIMDALAGLHHAHELMDYDGSPLEIVHRDVTPQNVFVTYDGQVKVVDFGIAKAAGRASETRQGVVKGKIRYMAPEQAVAQIVDRRADVFSIGVMLWEVAAGRRLWKDMEDIQIARNLIIGNYPSSPRTFEPSVPEELDRICQKALAARADDRYPTAEAMRLDLEQYLADNGHLVDARRKLAPALSELFKDKRQAIKLVIEQQTEALRALGTGEFRAVQLPAEMLASVAPSIPPTLVSAASGPGGPGFVPPIATLRVPAIAEPSTETRPTDFRPRRRLSAAVVVPALLGLVAIAYVGVVYARQAAKPPVESNGAVAQQPAGEKSWVRIRTTPSNARVSIDDAPALTAPLELPAASDDQEHRVRVEADGFVPRSESVRFSANVSVTIALEPVPTPDKTASPTGTTGHGAKAAPPPPRFTPAAPVAPPVATVAEPPKPSPSEPAKPAKPLKKPKTQIDDGDPWATK